MPLSDRRAAIERADSAAIVEQSMTIDPSAAPLAEPDGPRWTCSTSGASGRQDTTISEARPTSSKRSKARAFLPAADNSSASARALEAVREASEIGKPAFARLRAMPSPIVPRPMNPTGVAMSTSPAAILGEASYQIETVSAVPPAGAAQENALANSGRFDVGPSTRKRGGEWGSVAIRRRSASGLEFRRQD